jgi:hypothetical protein
MITPYDNDIRKSKDALKIASDRKDYPAIREELDHLHLLYLNVEISYCNIISKTEKVLKREGISDESKSMIEFLLSDLERDNKKIREGLREIIKKQNEYSFFDEQLEKMKLQLLIIPLTNPHMLN